MEAQPTSMIEFVSTLHGKQRRRERDLNKRDLQAAVKHATPERQRSGRLKYTFADVVYITDSTSTEEVTSYSLPLPLDKIDIHPTELHKVNEQQRRIRTGIPARSDAYIHFSSFHNITYFDLFRQGQNYFTCCTGGRPKWIDEKSRCSRSPHSISSSFLQHCQRSCSGPTSREFSFIHRCGYPD